MSRAATRISVEQAIVCRNDCGRAMVCHNHFNYLVDSDHLAVAAEHDLGAGGGGGGRGG